MKRIEERKKRIKRLRLIIFCLFVYIVFIMSCLFSINYTFNTMVTGKKYQNIFELRYKTNTIYVTIFGGERSISLKSIDEKIKLLLK